MLVVVRCKRLDFCHQVGNLAEGAAANGLLRDQSKPPFETCADSTDAREGLIQMTHRIEIRYCVGLSDGLNEVGALEIQPPLSGVAAPDPCSLLRLPTRQLHSAQNTANARAPGASSVARSSCGQFQVDLYYSKPTCVDARPCSIQPLATFSKKAPMGPYRRNDPLQEPQVSYQMCRCRGSTT